MKSKLTSAEIRDAVAKARKLEELQNLYFTNFGPESTFPFTVLFAFESDLKGGAEAEFARFRRVVEEAGPNRFGRPLVRILCVVGKGYWFYTDQQVQGAARLGWWVITPTGSHAEIRGLIGGVFNTIRLEKQRRYGLPFGRYIIEQGPLTPQD